MTEIPSKARRNMIEAAGQLCLILGLPRSTGQIYGLLYLSTKPLSLDDIVDLLGISKASASNGTRQLGSWGAVRQVWTPGQRKEYYEVVADLANLIQGGFSNFVQPRLSAAQRRAREMAAFLDEERAQGILSQYEYELCRERIENLTRLQDKLQKLAPLAQQLL